MGDIIDFTRKKKELKLEVKMNDEDAAQRILEVGIIALWDMSGGFDLQQGLEDPVYHLIFLSFSGLCFEQMQKGNIIVNEDGDIAIESGLKEVLFDAIKDFKREFTANDNNVD